MITNNLQNKITIEEIVRPVYPVYKASAEVTSVNSSPSSSLTFSGLSKSLSSYKGFAIILNANSSYTKNESNESRVYLSAVLYQSNSVVASIGMYYVSGAGTQYPSYGTDKISLSLSSKTVTLNWQGSSQNIFGACVMGSSSLYNRYGGTFYCIAWEQ